MRDDDRSKEVVQKTFLFAGSFVFTQRKLIRASGEGRITLLVINNPQKSIFLQKFKAWT